MHLILLILLALIVPLTSSLNFTNYTLDYGRIIEESPISILKPTIVADISILLTSINSLGSQSNLTVAPRGAGHSTYGQAQAPGGIVVDTTSLPRFIRVEKTYVDASGGALWIDVLHQTLKHGLSPRSWTDYLYLTVGGTLSNAGISGQTFKHGPQISNVIELDIVTGKGELITCSPHKNSDLFYGSLGGLGQFGIIMRARILLEPAPKMVKWVKVSYNDFDRFTNDQEFLISKGDVDYLEGFIDIRSNSSNNIASPLIMNMQTEVNGPDTYYTIELALYYNDKSIAQKRLNRVLSQLGFTRSMVNESDVSYLEFLNRVRQEEEELRKRGLWEVAHPWLNLFVPRAHIGRFKDLLLETISGSSSGGPMIFFPMLKHKWNLNMSAMLPQVHPEDDVVYAVSVLRAAPPSCGRGSQCLDTLLSQNQKIIAIATSQPNKEKSCGKTGEAASNLSGKSHDFSKGDGTGQDKVVEEEWEIKTSKGGMGAKQYLPYWKNEHEWRDHFGGKWNHFKELKNKFDPLNILTPGQRIFKRKSNDN